MAWMKKHKYKNEYVQVPNKTAKAVEKELSLQALGLLVNLWSYDVEKWELHKTELYKRFVKNKETSVSSAWKELMDNGYMIQFKYRVGKKWEYEYVYNIVPFTPEEKAEILAEAVEEYGEICTLDFQDLKMKSSKCSPQNQDISNNQSKKKSIKEKLNKNNNQSESEESSNLQSVINSVFNDSLTKRKTTDLIDCFDLYADKISIQDYKRILSRIKPKMKTIRTSFRNYVIKTIENYVKEQSENVVAPEKPVRKEIVPDWMGKKEKEGSSVPDSEMEGSSNFEEEKRKLEEEFKQYRPKE